MLVIKKLTWTVDSVPLLWTCSKKYLLGGEVFNANFIGSVSALEQCKSILEIKKWHFAFAKF